VPAGGKGKTNTHKAKANHHVPGADAWDWISSAADVENHDPDQTKQEICQHNWG